MAIGSCRKRGEREAAESAEFANLIQLVAGTKRARGKKKEEKKKGLGFALAPAGWHMSCSCDATVLSAAAAAAKRGFSDWLVVRQAIGVDAKLSRRLANMDILLIYSVPSRCMYGCHVAECFRSGLPSKGDVDARYGCGLLLGRPSDR